MNDFCHGQGLEASAAQLYQVFLKCPLPNPLPVNTHTQLARGGEVGNPTGKG